MAGSRRRPANYSLTMSGVSGPDRERPSSADGPDNSAPADASRRTFLLRAIGAISALIAAILAIPVVGFASAAGWRSSTPLRLLGESVAPTLRGSGWVSVGNLNDFEVGVPERVTFSRAIVDGWVSRDVELAAFVYRRREDKVVAFDIHCTHLGCPLSYVSGARRFLCPCHGGQFSREGNVVSGPPPRPMLQYTTKIEDGEVFLGPLEEVG